MYKDKKHDIKVPMTLKSTINFGLDRQLTTSFCIETYKMPIGLHMTFEIDAAINLEKINITEHQLVTLLLFHG